MDNFSGDDQVIPYRVLRTPPGSFASTSVLTIITYRVPSPSTISLLLHTYRLSLVRTLHNSSWQALLVPTHDLFPDVARRKAHVEGHEQGMDTCVPILVSSFPV